jgi:ZIP family zinc transporter
MALDAAMAGLLAASTLLLGGIAALWFHQSVRTIGLLLGLGAGALISALSFDLAQEALEKGGVRILVLGLVAGAATFLGGTMLLERGAGSRSAEESQARAIVLGAALDGVPESLVIGASVASTGGDASVAFLVAVALSNFPEGIGATAGLRRAGSSRREVLATWIGIVLLSVAASVLGYAALAESPRPLEPFLEAFAAGAVLTMLTDTMIPEAYRMGGRAAGPAAVAGFAIALLLT